MRRKYKESLRVFEIKMMSKLFDNHSEESVIKTIKLPEEKYSEQKEKHYELTKLII